MEESRAGQGMVDNVLSKMVKAKKLKRKPLGGKKGASIGRGDERELDYHTDRSLDSGQLSKMMAKRGRDMEAIMKNLRKRPSADGLDFKKLDGWMEQFGRCLRVEKRVFEQMQAEIRRLKKRKVGKATKRKT